MPCRRDALKHHKHLRANLTLWHSAVQLSLTLGMVDHEIKLKSKLVQMR